MFELLVNTVHSMSLQQCLGRQRWLVECRPGLREPPIHTSTYICTITGPRVLLIQSVAAHRVLPSNTWKDKQLFSQWAGFSHTLIGSLILRDSRKSPQKNGEKHGRLLWKSASRHQTTGPKTIIQSIKVNIWHRRPSLHALCSARFSSAKFCHSGALTPEIHTG